jgi:hypothetical protein
MSLAEQLDKSRGFNEIFLLVKKAVYKTLGRRRVGLMLGLSDMPPAVAAYYSPNVIVLNRKLIEKLKREMSDESIIKSYIFEVLLHEYLHSLGYDEVYANELAYMICKDNLGEEHPATKISRYGARSIFQSLKDLDEELKYPVKIKPRNIEFVKGFDSENVTYLA